MTPTLVPLTSAIRRRRTHGGRSTGPRGKIAAARRWAGSLIASMLAVLLIVLSGPGAALAQDVKLLAPHDVPDAIAPPDAVVIPALPQAFKTRDEGWVRFAFPASQEGRIKVLLEAANEAKADLTEELGRPVLDFVEIRIARTVEEMAALAPLGMPPPDYAEGVAYARSRLIIISLVAPNAAQPPVLPEVLKHELAHVALHDAVGGNPVPRWFNEGYAVHASGESSIVRTRTLWMATLGKRVLPMSDLDRSFPASSDLAAIAYAQSADFVRFLLRKQDRARFVMFVDRLAQGDKFEASIADAYSADLRRLEFQWREEINKRFSWAPVILGGSLLWVGAFVLIGVGWVKRRRDTRRKLARWAMEEAAEDRRARQAALLQKPPMHVIIRSRADAPVGFPEPPMRNRDGDVMVKVEHDGRWHTVH